MRHDPIIEELHAMREAHAAKFNFDVSLIGADILARQERARQSGRVFVSFPPRRPAGWRESTPNTPLAPPIAGENSLDKS